MKSLKMLYMVVCVVLVIIAMQCSYVQADVVNKCTIDLKDVDVVTAIEVLFKGTDKSFTVEGGVYGTIPVLHLTDVEFEFALRTITRACGLQYKVNGGAYSISPKPKEITTPDYGPVLQYKTSTTAVTTQKPTLDKFQLTHTGPANILNQLGTNNSTQHSSGNSYKSINSR